MSNSDDHPARPAHRRALLPALVGLAVLLLLEVPSRLARASPAGTEVLTAVIICRFWTVVLAARWAFGRAYGSWRSVRRRERLAFYAVMAAMGVATVAAVAGCMVIRSVALQRGGP